MKKPKKQPSAKAKPAKGNKTTKLRKTKSKVEAEVTPSFWLSHPFCTSDGQVGNLGNAGSYVSFTSSPVGEVGNEGVQFPTGGSAGVSFDKLGWPQDNELARIQAESRDRIIKILAKSRSRATMKACIATAIITFLLTLTIQGLIKGM